MIFRIHSVSNAIVGLSRQALMRFFLNGHCRSIVPFHPGALQGSVIQVHNAFGINVGLFLEQQHSKFGTSRFQEFSRLLHFHLLVAVTMSI